MDKTSLKLSQKITVQGFDITENDFEELFSKGLFSLIAVRLQKSDQPLVLHDHFGSIGFVLLL